MRKLTPNRFVDHSKAALLEKFPVQSSKKLVINSKSEETDTFIKDHFLCIF